MVGGIRNVALRIQFQRRGTTERVDYTDRPILLRRKSDGRREQHRQSQLLFLSSSASNSNYADSDSRL
jgi:hypothetical protein